MSLLLTLFVCLSFVPPEWIDLPQHATLTLVPSLATQSTTPYYTYTVIADLTNCDNVGRPVLNENGQVAFAARRDSPIGPQGGSVVIRRGDGSGPLVDIYTPGLSSSFTVPDTGISINDDGAIAFSASPAPVPSFSWVVVVR